MQLVGRLPQMGRVFGRLSALLSAAAALLPKRSGMPDAAPSGAPSTSVYEVLTQRVSLPIIVTVVPLLTFAFGITAITAEGVSSQASGYLQATALPGVLVAFMLAAHAWRARLQAAAIGALEPISNLSSEDFASVRNRTLQPRRSGEVAALAAGFLAWAAFERAWDISLVYPLTEGWVLVSHLLLYLTIGWFAFATTVSAYALVSLARGGLRIDIHRQAPVEAFARWGLAMAGSLAGATLIGVALSPASVISGGSTILLVGLLLGGAVVVVGTALLPAYLALAPLKAARRQMAREKIAEFSELMEARAQEGADAPAPPAMAANYASWVTYERVVAGTPAVPGGIGTMVMLGALVALPATVLALRLVV